MGELVFVSLTRPVTWNAACLFVQMKRKFSLQIP